MGTRRRCSPSPTCRTFPATEMTIITQDDKVKLKYYWSKHSGLKRSDSVERDSITEVENEESVGSKKGKLRGKVGGDNKEDMAALGLIPFASSSPSSLQSSLYIVCKCDPQEKHVNVLKMKLQEMEVFYQFVDAEEVGCHLQMAPETVDFLYQYWKLKHKANFNQLLLMTKKDEEDTLARREHEVLLKQLQLFIHLRQDLERVCNLTCMVMKMKRSMWQVEEQIFQHQIQLIDQELLSSNLSRQDLQSLFSLH
ncbi:protein Jade-1-like isoform X2 [Syngnathoides biaculeatus]|uniref:protein Jade-1-like isoform X2 n=1 Tax=Syngnathoides biaculeatus TaxID=300417 RepID=UPI002ADD8FC5|nr:protein Jade-1-like isoform X2 [Syngnathoides biaculeatus]